MKKAIALICIIAAVYAHLSVNVQAAPEKYGTLLSQITECDGAMTESVSFHLGQAFLADTQGLLTELSQQTSFIQQTAAKLLRYELPEVTIRAKIQPLREIGECTSAIYWLDHWESSVEFPAPTIGAISYSASHMEALEAQPVTVILSEKNRADLDRQWWVELYALADGTESLIAAGNVTLPAKETTVTAKFSAFFQKPGEYYTQVRVYDRSLGRLMNDRIGLYPDTVYPSSKVASAPVIGAMVYPEGSLRACDPQLLQVTIQEDAAIYRERSWWAEIYGIYGDTLTREASGWSIL